MSPLVLNLLLWVPFVLTVVISGIVFCRSGYRKGLWRALIALGATLAAAGLSILLAGLLSSLIAPAITGAIPVSALGSNPLTARMALALVGIAIRSALSMVLFWLLMLIFTIVLRTVSGKIQPVKLITPQKGLRWAGLGVGVLSALVFALLWLCPIYGSLAVFAPVADSALTADDQAEVRAYVQSVRQNPVVVISGTAPMRLVYNGAAATGLGSTAVPVTNMAEVMEEAAALATQTANSQDTAAVTQNAKQLVSLLRGKVVNQRWFHALATALAKEGAAGAAEIPGSEGDFLQEFIGVFDLPQDVFAENSDELLGFFEFALDNGIVDILQNEDWDALYTTGILEKAGALANCTDEAVTLKRLLITDAITNTLYDGDYAAAAEALKDFPMEKITDPALQLREAEAVMQYMLMNPSPVELILRYPALGEPAMEKLMEEADLLSFSGLHPETQDSIRSVIDDKPQYQEALYQQALHCAQAPIGTANFRNSCGLLLGLRNFAATAVMSYYDEYDADSLRFALDTMGIDAFVLQPAGKKIFVLMEQYPDLLEQDATYGLSDLSSGVNGLHGLIFAAVKHTVLNDPNNQNTFDLDLCVQMYAHNRLAVAAVKQYVDSHDSDPLQLAAKLSDREILALQNMIDGYYKNNELDAEALASNDLSSVVMVLPDSAAETMSFTGSGGGYLSPNMTAEEIEAYNKNLQEALLYLKLLLGI